MANATFGVNIIPKSNTVTIGNSDAPWKIVSPELTGVPTAPTAAAGSNTTQVATTAFVKSALPDVMTGATSLADGTSGLVPAPETTDVNKFLRSDGTWADAGSVLTKIPFSFAVSDWVSTAGVYEASVVNANFITTSEEFVLYDSSIEHLRSGLSAEKDTASTAMVFTTGTLPTGVISGNIYSINKNNGQIAVTFIDSVVPISRGGTGATTASAARTNLGIVSLPTVSSSDNGKVMTVVNGEWNAAAGVSPSNYESLGNKPSINSVTLSGNITSNDLGLASASDISSKADKVSSATNGNFAALDSNGNLTDSGHKHSDYLTSHQDISGKQDKTDSSLTTTAQTVVGAINENNTAITNCENYKAGDTITFYRYCLLAQSPSNGSANGYILMPKKMGSSLTISDSSVSVLMQDTTGNSITATATFARYSDEFLRVTLSASSGITSSSFYFVRFNATLTFS